MWEQWDGSFFKYVQHGCSVPLPYSTKLTLLYYIVRHSWQTVQPMDWLSSLRFRCRGNYQSTSSPSGLITRPNFTVYRLAFLFFPWATVISVREGNGAKNKQYVQCALAVCKQFNAVDSETASNQNSTSYNIQT